MNPARLRHHDAASRHLVTIIVIVVIQTIAATFFIADAIYDVWAEGIGWHIAIEGMIAFALAAGVVMGAREVRAMLGEAEQREETLAIASGALASVVRQRFEQWGLTASERDVALFALKGCNVGEIAALRSAAEGTVRAQLTRVYAKAGVANRTALIALFLEELFAIDAGETAEDA